MDKALCIFIYSSQQIYELDTIFPILHLSKLKPKRLSNLSKVTQPVGSRAEVQLHFGTIFVSHSFVLFCFFPGRGY